MISFLKIKIPPFLLQDLPPLSYRTLPLKIIIYMWFGILGLAEIDFKPF